MTETFDPEQTGNAALIAAISLKRDMPPRAATIALTTAIQESKIRNLATATATRWGSSSSGLARAGARPKEILDPVYSTNKFFDALEKSRATSPPTSRRSPRGSSGSGFPEAYRDHEGQGRVLASTLTGHSPCRLTCRLDAATAHVRPAERGGRPRQSRWASTRPPAGDGVLTVDAGRDARRAWAVAHWAVARAEQYGADGRVSVGERTWDRSDREAGTWSDGRRRRRPSRSRPSLSR